MIKTLVSHHLAISLSAAFLCAFFSQELDLLKITLFFCFTWAGYLFQMPRKTLIVSLLMCSLLLVGLVSLFFLNDRYVALACLFSGLCTLGYTFLRPFRFIKTPLIALSWGLFFGISFQNSFIFLAVTGLIFALTLPFDLRDKKSDMGIIKTFAHVLSPISLTLLSLIFGGMFFVFSNAFIGSIYTSAGLFVLFCFSVFGGIKKRSWFYYYVFLDGWPILIYLIPLCLDY